MSNLESLRQKFSLVAIILIWLNAGFLVPLSIMAQGELNFAVLAFAIAIAGGATWSWRGSHTGPTTRIVTSMALAGLVALMAGVLSGSAYQIDMHMCFFAMLAICAGWCDWRALVANAGIVALHHLILSYAMPTAVFPSVSPDIGRVFLHAAILIPQTAMLSWLTLRLEEAFHRSEGALITAAAAESQALQMAELQKGHAAEELEKRKRLQVEVGKFQMAVTQVVAALGGQVGQLQVAAQTLSAAAENATSEAETAATVSATAADNSNTVAAATEELSYSIREIAEQAQRTNSVVEAATQEAERTNRDVAGLATAAEEIGSIVEVIRGIADQTNLLALNATIEAARAGEAGRGFAVVATEVKELSSQTAKATDAIAEQIQAIQRSTGTAVGAIQAVGSKVNDIQSFTGAIAAAVEEQTAAAQEIASNVARSAEASEKAASSSNEVRQVAGQTKQQAVSISTVSQRLLEVSQQLSKSVEHFVSAIGEDRATVQPANAEPFGKSAEAFAFAEAA